MRWFRRLFGPPPTDGKRLEPAPPAPVEPSEPNPRERPRRRLHLGVDYGTAWSKLVLRDCASPRGEEAFVLRPAPPITLTEGEFRVPSIVVSDGRRLWFGGSASHRGDLRGHERYASLKIRASLPEHFFGVERPLPNGLSERDVATLHVAYLMAIGRLAAEEYARRQGVQPQLGFTLGVPASFEDNTQLRELFASMGRQAWWISEGADLDAWVARGLRIAEAAELLAEAEKAEAAAGASDAVHWVRNESVAALHWGFRSPRLEPGLYLTIDAGAGTTSAAWFRIVERFDQGMWEKAAFVFYGSSCRPPGVDKIDRELSLGLSAEADPAALRGREDELIEGLQRGQSARVRGVFDEIFKVSKTAFGQAYRKDARQSAWSPASLLLFGGGARIRELRPVLMEKPWPNLLEAPLLVDPGVPIDLREFGGAALQDGHDLLFVAYGLSFPLGDVPEYTPGRDVDDFKPWSYPSPEILDKIEWDV